MSPLQQVHFTLNLVATVSVGLRPLNYIHAGTVVQPFLKVMPTTRMIQNIYGPRISVKLKIGMESLRQFISLLKSVISQASRRNCPRTLILLLDGLEGTFEVAKSGRSGSLIMKSVDLLKKLRSQVENLPGVQTAIYHKLVAPQERQLWIISPKETSHSKR